MGWCGFICVFSFIHLFKQNEHCEIWNCVEFAVESEVFVAKFYSIVDILALNKFVERGCR